MQILTYATTWMKLEDQCQVKRTRCKETNTTQTHLYKDLKQLHRGRNRGGGFGGQGGSNGEWVQWGHSWQDEQVLESTVAMVTQQCECTPKNGENGKFYVHFITIEKKKNPWDRKLGLM